jgi:pimeloyl-ACP methyl ester carboxylesterase
LLVVLIGGMDSDPTPAQLAGTAVRQQGNSGMYQLAGDLSEDTYLPVYFNWNGSRAGELRRPGAPGTVEIARFIRGHVQAFPRDRVAIVGNSWGGQSAVEVLRALREDESPLAVQLVVLLDAASAGRGAGPPKALPENIARIIQYRTRNVFVWGELPPDRRLTTIDLGNPEAGFMRDGRPAYHAPFDFRAHVAAEWDEKIHDDIKQRLAAESAGLIIAGK